LASARRWQDISKLVDVCRQAIVFEDVGSLVRCLRVLQRDADVTVVRVKNRLDPAFDSRRSAGFRNVSVNLRLVTPETVELGLETHVCELQLSLRSMDELAVRAASLCTPSCHPCVPSHSVSESAPLLLLLGEELNHGRIAPGTRDLYSRGLGRRVACQCCRAAR
jgi:hypothetical protein